MKRKIIFAVLGVLPSMILAQSPVFPTLNAEFNQTDFQLCQTNLKKCPKNGPFLSDSCVKQLVNSEKACAQLALLSHLTDVSADQVSAQNYGNLTLLSLHYPADGKIKYAVLANAGKLILIDDLVKANLKQTTSHELFLTVISQPVYQISHSGDRSFTFTMQIAQDCVSCKTVNTIKAVLHFDVHGNYIFYHAI